LELPKCFKQSRSNREYPGVETVISDQALADFEDSIAFRPDARNVIDVDGVSLDPPIYTKPRSRPCTRLGYKTVEGWLDEVVAHCEQYLFGANPLLCRQH
jgi:hypothetical protein